MGITQDIDIVCDILGVREAGVAVKCCIREMAVVLFWAFMLSGCSEQNDNVDMLSSVEIGETDFKKRDCRVFVEEVQILHVEAEGKGGIWVSAERKFEYGDVNFDGLPDLLICTGRHGVQGVLTYYCFLQTENGFAEAPTFTDISDSKADAESELVLGQWRNSADSYSWAEYQYQDGTYVIIRELREETCYLPDQDVRVWTINGIEVGRSDLLSEEETEDLLYNENSEWKLDGDRWRMKYH